MLEACHRHTQVGLSVVERRQPRLNELKAYVVGAQRYRLALLLCPPLGVVRVAFDSTCLLGVRRTDLRWFVC
jgi:hypothetical protein